MTSTAALRRFRNLLWPYGFDATIAVLLLLVSAVAAAEAGSHAGLTMYRGSVVATEWLMSRAVPIWWAFTTLLAIGLLLHRRWPLPALALAGLGAAGHMLDLYQPGLFPQPIDLAAVLVVGFVAAFPRRTAAAIAAGTALALAYAASAASTALHQSSPKYGADPSLAVVLTEPMRSGLPVLMAVIVAFAVGDMVRNRRAHARALEQRAADRAREQEQQAALAIAAERARIGRELHDVIAHSLTVMVAQAQAATAAQDKHPQRSTQAMNEVVTVGRASLAEMRRLLTADPAGAGLGPQPGVAALAQLFDRMRTSGVAVRHEATGEPVDLPTVVDLAAYRIIQEALTNTLKHAGVGAGAVVSLAYAPHHLDIEVTDNGAGSAADPKPKPGNGLRGIAERVHLIGGTLDYGPAPAQGYAVRVRLPTGEDPS